MRHLAVKANVGLNIFVIVGLGICIVLAGYNLQQSHNNSLLLENTIELAAELRQSSDDLTRFIRTYTVTGNASYWQYFQQILDIRNGLLPLPVQPWRNWWDLFVAYGVPPRPLGKPSALLDRMRAARFTEAEMALLDEAKRQSDALVEMENTAYNAMNGRYRPTNTTGLNATEALEFSVTGPPNETFARLLVHSIPYHQWKGRIMRPIDDFSAISSQRVVDSINRNFRISIILIAMLAVMLALLIALLLLYFCKVAKDSQTAVLLDSMLPTRVVNSVSVNQFTELKAVAARHARKLRNVNATAKPTSRFPALYSEFLPVAWVGFTDVVKFTNFCRVTSADVVISLLNELFSLLDVAAISFGVEKIKTIGDAFMAAKLTTSELTADHTSGVPNTHKVAKDGIDILQFLLRAIRLAQSVTIPTAVKQAFVDTDDDGEPAEPTFQLRAGLHAGPVASGIVGFERPLYDLFGDTVNTASRLESSGTRNRVQVLVNTMPMFDEYLRYIEFDSEVQEVELKGIGTSETRLIRGCSMPHDDSCSFVSRASAY